MFLLKKKKEEEEGRYVTVVINEDRGQFARAYLLPAAHLTRPRLAPFVAMAEDDEQGGGNVIRIKCDHLAFVYAMARTAIEEADAGRPSSGAPVPLPPRVAAPAPASPRFFRSNSKKTKNQSKDPKRGPEPATSSPERFEEDDDIAFVDAMQEWTADEEDQAGRTACGAAVPPSAAQAPRSPSGVAGFFRSSNKKKQSKGQPSGPEPRPVPCVDAMVEAVQSGRTACGSVVPPSAAQAPRTPSRAVRFFRSLKKKTKKQSKEQPRGPEPERFVTVHICHQRRPHFHCAYLLPASHLTRPRLAPFVAMAEGNQQRRRDVIRVSCNHSEFVEAMLWTAVEEAQQGRTACGLVVDPSFAEMGQRNADLLQLLQS